MPREIKFYQAIHEAMDQAMEVDPRVYIMGLGVPDPKGVFGTTLGLQEKYGPDRVLDMPVAENGMTGVALGTAITGMRPILCHQRMDFSLMAVEQMVNQAAKWHYMFGGRMRVPLVIRMVVGRGWGQGPQHSQSLQAMFAHVPGLKVVLPATPHDAKGLLAASIEDDDPVIFIEHRWLHNTFGPVPAEHFRVPLGQARVVRPGRDLTIVAVSYMVLEALRAAEMLAPRGIEAEVIDLRSVKPLDVPTILSSVRRTGRLIAADTSWKSFGVAAEIVARAAEEAFEDLKAAPVRAALPDCPVPTSAAIADLCYPRAIHLAEMGARLMNRTECFHETRTGPLDVPDASFSGPF